MFDFARSRLSFTPSITWLMVRIPASSLRREVSRVWSVVVRVGLGLVGSFWAPGFLDAGFGGRASEGLSFRGFLWACVWVGEAKRSSVLEEEERVRWGVVLFVDIFCGGYFVVEVSLCWLGCGHVKLYSFQGASLCGCCPSMAILTHTRPTRGGVVR